MGADSSEEADEDDAADELESNANIPEEDDLDEWEEEVVATDVFRWWEGINVCCGGRRTI